MSIINRVANRHTMTERVAVRHLHAETVQPPPGFTRVEGGSGYSKGEGASYEYWSPTKPNEPSRHPKSMKYGDYDNKANSFTTHATHASALKPSSQVGHATAYGKHMLAGMAHHHAGEVAPTEFGHGSRLPKNHQQMARHHFGEANKHWDKMNNRGKDLAREHHKTSARAGGTDGVNHHEATHEGLAAHISQRQLSENSKKTHLPMEDRVRSSRLRQNTVRDSETEGYHKGRAQTQGHGARTHHAPVHNIIQDYQTDNVGV